MSKTFCQVINYFTWRTDIFPLLGISPAVLFFWIVHIFISRKDLIKISIFPEVFIIFLELAISTLSATLQAGDLIDQVDRERGANRNQSRGIQFIHAKRLTHHPNTRCTLLVMDSWHYIVTPSVLIRHVIFTSRQYKRSGWKLKFYVRVS